MQRGELSKTPRRILLPCDYSVRTERSLSIAREIDAKGDSKFECFHVRQIPVPILDVENFKKNQKANKVLEGERREAFQVLGQTASSILRESKNFDLIAMAPHSREGYFASFGSVTTKVIRTSSIPVLITH